MSKKKNGKRSLEDRIKERREWREKKKAESKVVREAIAKANPRTREERRRVRDAALAAM